jgi:hypothetical protein
MVAAAARDASGERWERAAARAQRPGEGLVFTRHAAHFVFAQRGSWCWSDAGKVGAVAVGIVVWGLAGPVSLVLEQNRRWALQRRVAHPTILLPMVFGKDGHARRTLVANTQGDARDARRAPSDHVVEATETNHAAVVGPE